MQSIKTNDVPSMGIRLEKKITILQPHDKQRNLYLAALLSEDNSFYHKATPSNALEEYTQSIFQALSEQYPAAQVRKVAGKNGANEAGRALAAAIGQASIRTIILDEIDALDLGDNLPNFVRALAAVLPKETSIVIAARSIDFGQWQTALETGEAGVLGTDGEILNKRVEVYSFGVGTVYCDGKPVTVWDGPLPRSLFFYFTDHPLITRTEIFETFWPDFPVKDATNVFHVTKRKVAERVGYETMIYASGFYRQASDVTIYYDVADFEACIARGQTEPDDLEAWERAVHLYRAPFLHQMQMPWVVERRTKLASDYTEALSNVGRYYEEKDPERALNLYLRAEREAPFREDIYRHAMQIYAANNQREMVDQQYRLLETRLHEAYKIQPGRATRELYESLTNLKGRR
jgi:DNA-binding SARP family transcriptional activator